MSNNSNNIVHVNDDNFHEKTGKGVVLVDFFAQWCGPCRMMEPVIEEFAEEMKSEVTVAQIDIDASQKTTQTFQVTSIPTLILFKDGKEVKRVVGLKDIDALKLLVKPFIS